MRLAPFLDKAEYCARCGRTYAEVEPNYAPGFASPLGCIPCRNATLKSRGIPIPRADRKAMKARDEHNRLLTERRLKWLDLLKAKRLEAEAK